MEATILTIFVGAFILVFFVDGILQDGFIEIFVKLMEIFHVDHAAALQWYSVIFQQNKLLIVVVGFFILFIFIFYMTLNGLTKYIDQIGNGIENILSDSTEPIQLIRELKPLENRMNSIKNRLRQREQEAAEAEQKKNDLLVYLAHDLKTPLTSIIAYLIAMFGKPGARQAQISERIHAPFEFFHLSFWNSPDKGGSKPTSIFFFEIPYSAQLGEIIICQV